MKKQIVLFSLILSSSAFAGSLDLNSAIEDSAASARELNVALRASSERSEPQVTPASDEAQANEETATGQREPASSPTEEKNQEFGD